MLEIEPVRQTTEPRYKITYWAPGYSKPLVVAHALTAAEVLELIHLLAEGIAAGGPYAA